MDGRGVMGFPLRMAIAFLIIALFVPSLVVAAEHFSEESSLDSVRRQADVVVSSSERLWYAGKGSTETVTLEIPAGYEIIFGGEKADQWSYSLCKGDTVKEKNYLDSPKIRFLDNGLTAVGRCSLTLTCTTDADGNYGIEVKYT